MEPALDPKRLRALLAEAQISTRTLARVARLHPVYVGGILTGRVKPGELARIKITRALVSLGLESEVRHAQAS